MANSRLQYRQVFWRNGWFTASERAGQAPTGQRRARRGTTTVTARSVGARGGHEGPALFRALTPTLESASTLPDCGGTSPAQGSYRTPSGQARAPTTTRSSESWRLCRRCVGVRNVPPGAPASRCGAEDSRAAERQRPSGRGPRARERRLQARLAQQPTPSVPTVAACARRAFRGTRVVARRNALAGSSSTTPSGPTRPFRLARVTRPGMTNTDVRGVIPGVMPVRRAGRPAGPWRSRPSPGPPPGARRRASRTHPAISSVTNDERS